jgi:RNA polymerase primary sigma factor
MASNVYEVKDKEQRKALNLWAKHGFVGSIIAGTGFGKSRCGVLAIGKLLKPGERALVLVPTNQLEDQFAEEFKKWGYEEILDQITIMCYQSAHKLRNEKFEMVVCDEIHLGLSPVYRNFFEYNQYDKLLCMTATVPEEEEYMQYLHKLAPVRYKISLDECVTLGLVAPYEVVCVPIDLNEEDKLAYKKANNKFVQAKYRIGGFNTFDDAKAILAKKIQGDAGAAKMFFDAIRERKQVVQHASSKIDKAQELVKQHDDAKILVFSGSNSFSDSMGDALGGLVYHSGLSKGRREKVLQRFESKSERILCSTKALNQGFNVPDASIGIIAGLDSKSLPLIQRVGRLLRLNKDKVGKIYILYVKDSQEEKWVKNAVKPLTNVTWL